MTVEKTSFKGAEGNRLAADYYPAGAEKAATAHAILLHGGGQTRHSWAGSARRLAAQNIACYTIDARGHGESDWPASKRYTFWDYAADVAEIARSVRERHGRAPIAIGASLGGISSMLVAKEYGEGLFEKLILVDITPRMDPQGVAKITGFMSSAMEEGFASVEEAADAIAAYLPNRQRPKSLAGLQKNLRKGRDGRWFWHWDPDFLRGEFYVGSRSDELVDALVAGVSRLTIPTLLVRGGQSELVTREHVAEFMALVPHAKFVDVSDAGHMVAGDKNDKFTEAVVSFLV